MIKDDAVNALVKSANAKGLVATMYETFGKRIKVSVPFDRRACDTSIDELDFSVRANNSMKRAGVFTVGEVVDLIANEELPRIRNLGKKTENEIKTRILMFGYERLSNAEKKKFFCDIVNRNFVCSI